MPCFYSVVSPFPPFLWYMVSFFLGFGSQNLSAHVVVEYMIRAFVPRLKVIVFESGSLCNDETSSKRIKPIHRSTFDLLYSKTKTW
jgi:hypothetical protein